jgi:alpha-glucoside transport system permease protein
MVVGLCAVWFVPALGLIVTSFRPPTETTTSGWWSIVVNPVVTVDNYVEALSSLGLGTGLVNSLLIAAPATAIVVVVAAFGAYTLACMRFAGRDVLFVGIVLLMVVPHQVAMVPLLRLFNDLGLGGSVISVWLIQAGFTLPFGIFLLRGFFAAIPEELLDAARVDGASELRTFVSVVLPLSTPPIASLAILSFLWAWNELLLPLLFLGGQSESTPLTVQIAGLVQQSGQGANLLTAGALVSAIVPVVVFFGLQRYFVRGLVQGAVKG